MLYIIIKTGLIDFLEAPTQFWEFSDDFLTPAWHTGSLVFCLSCVNFEFLTLSIPYGSMTTKVRLEMVGYSASKARDRPRCYHHNIIGLHLYLIN